MRRFMFFTILLTLTTVWAADLTARPRSELKPATKAVPDSALTVTDGSIGTNKMDQTNVIDLLAPGIRIFSDSLVFSAIWCNYQEIRGYAGAGVCTNFVACSIVDDTTNTFVVPVPYMHFYGASYYAMTTANRFQPIITLLDSGAGFWWALPDGTCEKLYYERPQGFFWLVLRFTSPP